eukprot:12927694-Prorocentrum_lima.AAC.1
MPSSSSANIRTSSDGTSTSVVVRSECRGDRFPDTSFAFLGRFSPCVVPVDDPAPEPCMLPGEVPASAS